MNKRIISCGLCIAAFALLYGCSRPETQYARTSDKQNEESRMKLVYSKDLDLMSVFTSDNGCKYLIWRGSQKGGITPLMRPDGTQECGQ